MAETYRGTFSCRLNSPIRTSKSSKANRPVSNDYRVCACRKSLRTTLTMAGRRTKSAFTIPTCARPRSIPRWPTTSIISPKSTASLKRSNGSSASRVRRRNQQSSSCGCARKDCCPVVEAIRALRLTVTDAGPTLFRRSSGGMGQRRSASTFSLSVSRLAVVDQVAGFFLEAAEDACLGLADGNLAHAQGGRYLGRSLIVDGGPPEGLPGVVLEVAADQLQGAVVDITELGSVRSIVGKGGVGNFLKQPVHVGAALSRRLALAALVEIAQLVPRNGSQPGAE